MTKPWLTFGMTFSSFPWESESHSTLSISYAHCGERTWYSIPSQDAKNFKKDLTPQQFPFFFLFF